MSTVLDAQVITGASSLSSVATDPTQSVTSLVRCPVIVESVMLIVDPAVASNVPGNFRIAPFRIVNDPPFTLKSSFTYALRDRGSVVMIELSRIRGRPAVTVRE